MRSQRSKTQKTLTGDPTGFILGAGVGGLSRTAELLLRQKRSLTRDPTGFQPGPGGADCLGPRSFCSAKSDL
jgi:hypothetical protein